jgi:hypothetical protein
MFIGTVFLTCQQKHVSWRHAFFIKGYNKLYILLFYIIDHKNNL